MTQTKPERSWYNDQPLEQRKIWYSQVAEAYNRVRPRYPQELINQVISWANLPTHANLLEIGCGPGTATISFADLGFSIVALEPSLDAYQLAQKNCISYPNVQLLNTTFEEWEIKPAQFDAVLAANSFHWVSPEVGYRKVAVALRPQGSLILLWNMALQPSYEIYQDLHKVYQVFAPALAGYETSEMQQESLRKFEEMVVNSGQFQEVLTDQQRCEVTYKIDDYLDLLSTYSPYIGLEVQQREGLFQGLRAVLEKSCGQAVKLSFISAFQLARK